MHALEFLKSVKAEDIPPIFFLLGAERLLQQRIIKKLTSLLLPEEVDGTADYIDGGEQSLTAILDLAASDSLLADHRIVVAWNADCLDVPAGSPEIESLDRYLDSPNPTVALVLAAESIDARKSFFKLLAKKTLVIDCSPLKGAALRSWIVDYLRERGFGLDRGGAEMVEELVGSDLLLISNALEKVMIYCGERNRISCGDLEKTLNVAREHAIWELTKAVGTRDAAAALNALARLLEGGKHPLQITASIQFQFRQLMIVRDMVDRRLARDKIIEAAGLRFYADRTVSQARAFSASELDEISRCLFKLENDIKSAGIDERFLLERAVLAICRQRRETAGVRG